MAHNKIYFEHPVTKISKEAPVGFSGTTFFFGGIVALTRGDVKWGLIQIFIQLFTWGLSSFVYCFVYNKIFINELVSQGFKVKSVESGTIERLCAEVGINLNANSSTESQSFKQNNSDEDNLKNIERLYELKKSGALTNEEYEQKKQSILKKAA